MPRYKLVLEVETHEQDHRQSYNELLSAVEEGVQRVGRVLNTEITALVGGLEERDLIQQDWKETQNFMECLRRYKDRNGSSLREAKCAVEAATGQRYQA